MKAVQTIELNEDERLVLIRALKLVGQIATVTDIAMNDIFDYFVDNYISKLGLTENELSLIEALHNVEDMRGEA